MQPCTKSMKRRADDGRTIYTYNYTYIHIYIYTYTIYCAHCCTVYVGLAQARPNYMHCCTVYVGLTSAHPDNNRNSFPASLTTFTFRVVLMKVDDVKCYDIVYCE